MIDRRTFAFLMAAGSLGVLPRAAGAQQALPEGSVHAGLDLPIHDISSWPADWTGDEQVVILAYPGITAIDLFAPQYMFGSLWGAAEKVVAKTLDPVVSDTRLAIVPDITFDQAHAAPDILFVPGGISGTLNAMKDRDTVDFITSRGKAARYVTSVCTGALILGQAGLLDGYRATTHWLAMSSLDAFGAKPVNARVVRDCNRFTGVGVTAVLDFGLTMLKELRGRKCAQSIQLFAEYAPEPPLQAGTLETAPERVRQIAVDIFPGCETHARAIAATSR